VDIINALRPDYETSHWFDKPSVDDDEVARKKRDAQRKWRDAHREEINAHRRERAKLMRSAHSIPEVRRKGDDWNLKRAE
jgi:hypothetical protein